MSQQLTVIFRGTQWICRTLEMTVMEIFVRNGWMLFNRFCA
uniref:Uncharacterized protein n=1 Tax=Arundo donax TaxID=35708 RepID=A0A0A9AEX8_ARUDO